MRLRAVSIAVLTVAAALHATVARADIPPDNACGEVGSACNTAGDGYKQAGVCTQTKCSRTFPGPDGLKTVENDCNLCMVKTVAATTTAEAGATSSAASGSNDPAGSSGAGVPPEATPPHGGCAGCSVSDGRAGVVAFASIVGAALFAGGLGARRRARAAKERSADGDQA